MSSDGSRERKHEPAAAPIKQKRNRGQREPVGRVGGGKTVAVGVGRQRAVGHRRDIALSGLAKKACIRLRDERARAGHVVLEGADYQRIAQGDDQHHEQRAEPQPRGAEKKHRRHGDDDGGKPRQAIAAQDRHQPVEERIGQRAVDEMKQRGVERLKPVHPAEL